MSADVAGSALAAAHAIAAIGASAFVSAIAGLYSVVAELWAADDIALARMRAAALARMRAEAAGCMNHYAARLPPSRGASRTAELAESWHA
jgi:hypothetical protein